MLPCRQDLFGCVREINSCRVAPRAPRCPAALMRCAVMVVFIGNLPKQAVEKDLCQIARLAAAARVRIFKKKSRSGDVYRFALVPVNNDRQARRLAKRIQGFLWHGHRLVARVYRQRKAVNEQRRVDWRAQSWSRDERRRCERRNRFAA